MRIRVPLAAFALVAIAAACTRDDGGGGGTPSGEGDLTSGRYEISDVEIAEDECSVMQGLDGREIDVVVDGESLTYESGTGEIEDGVFEALDEGGLDFNDDPFGEGALDCVFGRVRAWFGITTANDQADVEYDFSMGEGDGPECAEAELQIAGVVGHTITFPCASAAFHQIVRLPDPPVYSGTVSLVATNGLLTNDATTASDAGFTLTGSLDGSGPFSEPNNEWRCFVPAPPVFPNYDLYLGSEYTVTLSITTADWAVGSIPVNDLNEASLSGPGFAATITGGTLEILGAPVVVGSSYRCAVSLSNAPFTNQPR